MRPWSSPNRRLSLLLAVIAILLVFGHRPLDFASSLLFVAALWGLPVLLWRIIAWLFGRQG
jgi:hypothetical protein